MHVEKVEGNTTTIKAKIKNRNAYALLFFTEIVPQKKFQMSYKGLCFTQLSNIHYEKISPLKTRITVDTNISGFLTPLFRSSFKKKVEAQYPEMLKALLVYVSNDCS